MSMYDIMNITVYNNACIWVYLLNAKLWVRPKAKLEMHIRYTHIRSVNIWVLMVVFNQDLLRKVEFYEYKMYLDVEIVAPFMLLHISTIIFRNIVYGVISWFHHCFIFLILFLFDRLLISVLCRNVALMITESRKCKWKNEHRENWEKKEEKLNISISNRKIRFLNFLRFIAFAILETFKSVVIRPEALVLCRNIKKFANLWHLWRSIYEAKLTMHRRSRPDVFCKKVFLENLQNSQENTCARVSFK